MTSVRVSLILEFCDVPSYPGPLCWPVGRGISGNRCTHMELINGEGFLRKREGGDPIVAQWFKNPTSIHEDSGLILALLSGLKIHHCPELWCSLVAIALV